MPARLPGLLLALNAALLGGSTACGGEGAGSSERPAPAAPSEPQGPTKASPWRFVPTLEQHLPAGAVGEIVLELSQPRQRAVVILAAVLRSGAEHVEIERWTFAQSPDGQSLDLVTSGEPILRLRPGTRSPALGELRRELATPRVVLTRPLGLAGLEPTAMLGALATAFATLRDAKAEPRARVEAAAVVVRGLDDTVVFDRDAIWEVGDFFQIPRDDRALVLETVSERRVQGKLETDEGTITLELQRKSDGWAITSLERSKRPEAAPPSDASGDGAPRSPGKPRDG